MKLCGLYARVSTDLQAQVKDGSLDTQLDRLSKYVELKDGSDGEEWKAVDLYREEGKSGKDTGRPEFQRLLEDIQSGKVNTVLCTKIDRISRSLIDLLEFQKYLDSIDVSFISLNENWDTSTPMGKFVLTIIGAAAQLEREQTAERTREKMQWRAEQGLCNGGRILGYDIDPENPGIPPVNDQEKVLVNLIFETYVEKKSLKPVAQFVNSKGYRSKLYTSRRGRVQGGNKFMKTTIHRILTNPFYIGKIVHKGNVYEGQHKAIIPIELWEKVQKIIASNQGVLKRPRKHGHYTFLLKGLVRCGKCGSHMVPFFTYNRHKNPYFYYACNRDLKIGKDACDMGFVPARALGDLVAKRLTQLQKNPQKVSALVSDASLQSSQKLQELSDAQGIHEQHRTQVERKIGNLVDSLAEGGANVKAIGQKIVELEEQKEELDAGLQDLKSEIVAIKKKVVNFDTFADTLTTFSELYADATLDERKELMQLHIHQLVWNPNKLRMAIYERPDNLPEVLTAPGKVCPVVTIGSGGWT